jgi:hypothetical protein
MDEPITRLKLGITSDAHSEKLRFLIDLFYQCTRGSASRRPKAEQVYNSLCSLPTCYDLSWTYGSWIGNLIARQPGGRSAWSGQVKLDGYSRSLDLANFDCFEVLTPFAPHFTDIGLRVGGKEGAREVKPRWCSFGCWSSSWVSFVAALRPVSSVVAVFISSCLYHCTCM